MGRAPQPDLVLPFAQWPDNDRSAWEQGCLPSDPFDTPRRGATLRTATLLKYRQGYGCWLAFLRREDLLARDALPLARVTPALLRRYLRALRSRGNSDYTIIGRFAELAGALRIMVPDADVSWIQKPFGVTVYAALPKRCRAKLIPDSDVLFAWGIEMMDAARTSGSDNDAAPLYRDGLLIAMLAARGRRRRSMAALRHGTEITERDGFYRIELAPDQVKTNRPDSFNLPEMLTPHIQYYLTTVRPQLLRGRVSDVFWITRYGTPMAGPNITNQIVRRTRRRFGQGFGPHRFRHAIATTAAVRVPGDPRLAADLLNITLPVVKAHYAMPGQASAVRMLARLNERRLRER